MTIYVCSLDGGYDGYYPPSAAFSTRELAQDYVDKRPREDYNSWEVEELEVDKP